MKIKTTLGGSHRAKEVVTRLSGMLWSDFATNSWLTFILDRLPDGVIVGDDQSKVVYTNQMFCDYFFEGRTPADLMGRDIVQMLRSMEYPPDRIDFPTHVSEYTPEDRIEWITRTGRVMVINYVPFFHGDTGMFEGHMCLITDETEVIAQAAKREEERKFYETVLDSIPGDLVVLSAEGSYMYISPLSVRDPVMREWMIGKNDFDYCIARGKDINIAKERMQMIAEVKRRRSVFEWEETIVNKQGQPEYHRRFMYPIFDDKGEIERIVGWGTDVTESKLITQKIQSSEKKLKDIFTYSQAVIATHDIEGRILECNPALTELTGYTEEELKGHLISKFMHPNDAPLFDELYLNAILHNKRMKGLLRIQNKFGRKVFLLYHNYLLESGTEPSYIITFAQDVTDRIKAEKELKEAKKLTEETARLKERFLANMSHEIRTPMNGIIGVTNILRKTQLNEEQAEYLRIINDSAQNLVTIINDILDLEKIGSGKIVLEKTPFNIVEKLSNTVSLFAVTAIQKMVNVTVQNELGKVLMVKGDPTRLSQVLNNLLSNAVKFTDQGSVTISAHILEETEYKYKLKFSIKDTGIGIDDNDQIAIFQPFKQAYASSVRQYGGTGLGLAITKNLVELQGGEIWVESQLRQGSTFHFTIEVEKVHEKIQPLITPPAKTVNELGRLRILMAEDNLINQMLTTRILDSLGFDSLLANNGHEALSLLETGKFDLVLMDIQMPDMNGIEATQIIRRQEAATGQKPIPIIALTANALKGDELEYYQAGMNGYLTKPFNEEQLYQCIAAQMQGQKA